MSRLRHEASTPRAYFLSRLPSVSDPTGIIMNFHRDTMNNETPSNLFQKTDSEAFKDCLWDRMNQELKVSTIKTNPFVDQVDLDDLHTPTPISTRNRPAKAKIFIDLRDSSVEKIGRKESTLAREPSLIRNPSITKEHSLLFKMPMRTRSWAKLADLLQKPAQVKEESPAKKKNAPVVAEEVKLELPELKSEPESSVQNEEDKVEEKTAGKKK